VVGPKDVEPGTVGVNERGADHDERGVPLDAFVERLRPELSPPR
jgi:hypothetical protein